MRDLRELIIEAEERALMNRVSRKIIGEERAVKGVIRRAIEYTKREKNLVRSQDKVVYNFLHNIYEFDREKIRKKYLAYKRLRDYALKK